MHRIASGIHYPGHVGSLIILNGLANPRMAYAKPGMGCRTLSGWMHHSVLFSNSFRMAIKTG